MKENESELQRHVIEYQEQPLPISKRGLKRNFKPMRGLWIIDYPRYITKPRQFINKTTSVLMIFWYFAIDILNRLRYNSLQNISERIKITMSKTVKNTEEKVQKPKNIKAPFSWKKVWNGIMGVGQLFVAGSIIASTVIIVNGTEGLETRVIVAPMAIYAVIILVTKFISNNKGSK